MEELLKYPLTLDPPLTNAAGSLGFYPDMRLPLPWERFGAFVTNPISARARKPAAGTRLQTAAASMLLHSGHPNPGFGKILKRCAARWAQSDLPVIVHLLAASPPEMARLLLSLEELENLLAVEVGFPEHIERPELAEVLAACAGELPVIARLPLNKAIELAPTVAASGAAALSLGAPRGSLPASKGLIHGRIYGPAVFPLALNVVAELAGGDIPVIGSGGVYRPEQVEQMRAAGAYAVQVDTALWRGDWFQREGGA